MFSPFSIWSFIQHLGCLGSKTSRYMSTCCSDVLRDKPHPVSFQCLTKMSYLWFGPWSQKTKTFEKVNFGFLHDSSCPSISTDSLAVWGLWFPTSQSELLFYDRQELCVWLLFDDFSFSDFVYGHFFFLKSESGCHFLIYLITLLVESVSWRIIIMYCMKTVNLCTFSSITHADLIFMSELRVKHVLTVLRLLTHTSDIVSDHK